MVQVLLLFLRLKNILIMHKALKETFSKYSRIIFVGWGTGGHIQPILSLSQELKEKGLLWIWGKDSHEEFGSKQHSIPFESIPTLKLRTTKSPEVLIYPIVLVQGIFQARRILKKYKKEEVCVFSKWWPWSVAISIAAWTLGIPLYIHESDTIPGRSNRILGKFATKIFLGFESAIKYFNPEKCVVLWQILSRVFSRKEVLSPKEVSWKTQKKHILVICGSQWARVIFEEIISDFGWSDLYEWIIALGKLNESMKHDFDSIQDTQALSWIPQDDIAYLLQDTDIAITRGSATTLAEIEIYGVKKIIIPLPYSADNHQYWNAKEYEKNGDILLEQKNLKDLPEIIKNIWQNSPPSNISQEIS